MINDLEELAANLPPLTLARILVDLEPVPIPMPEWLVRVRLAFRGALLANVGPEPAAALLDAIRSDATPAPF